MREQIEWNDEWVHGCMAHFFVPCFPFIIILCCFCLLVLINQFC
jgi:hypothetical protein